MCWLALTLVSLLSVALSPGMLKPVCVCRSGYEEEEVEAVCEVPGRRLPPKDPVTQFNARTTQYVNSTLLRYYYKAKHIKPVSF